MTNFRFYMIAIAFFLGLAFVVANPLVLFSPSLFAKYFFKELSFALSHPRSLFQSTYRFRMEAHFTFDDKPYIAVGYMECVYRSGLFNTSSKSKDRHMRIAGFYTSSHKDSPSIVLPDGKGAILFQDHGGCPSLPWLTEKLAENSAEVERSGPWHALHFADPNDPKFVTILRTFRRGHQVKGRIVLNKYVLIPTNLPGGDMVAKNVPAAWRWYEKTSDKSYRNHFNKDEEVWSRLVACFVPEHVWLGRPEFEQAAQGVREFSAVKVMTERRGSKRPMNNCPVSYEGYTSLVPSRDYRRATIHLDGADLRWTAVTTPYRPENWLLGTNLWMPEICIAGERCTNYYMELPVLWLFWPERRAFIHLSHRRFDAYQFKDFALRHKDLFY